MNDLLTCSALELARRIRAGEVAASEVVEAHIGRIQAVNPRVNAVVVPTFDAARAEAKAADERIARTPKARRRELPPLLGVPFTAKESYGVAGLPVTLGLLSRRGRTAPEDATAVRRLREAGAILLGKTNLSEALMWMESYNKVYGKTGNAHDPARTAGGSSGGEGSIIGAAGSPMGLGSDVGGSIRLPAAMNGVVGHKPSSRLVSGAGHYPMATGEVARYAVCGPLGRRVADAAELLRIVSGPDGVDAEVVHSFAPETIDPKRVRVFVFEDNGVHRPSAEVAAGVRRAASALADAGLRVERWTPPGVARAVDYWAAILSQAADAPSFAEVLGDGTPVAPGRELLRWAAGRSPHTFPALGIVAFEKLKTLSEERNRRMLAPAREMQRAIEEKLGPHGALLCPAYPAAAPRHHAPMLLPFGFVYCGLWNAMEFPATVLPVDRSRAGLPLPVQVVGARGRDATTLWVAERLEEALGGWGPPADLA